MRVLWTRAAQADLETISDFIKTDNSARALSFIDEIIAAGDGIADMPRAFPLVPQLEHRGIRRRRYRRYLIFYRIEADDVQILHVVHGARNYVLSLFS